MDMDRIASLRRLGLPQTFRASVEGGCLHRTGGVHRLCQGAGRLSDTSLFVQKELDILGSRNALPENFREVIGMLESKRFPVDDAISAVVPIEEAPEMLRQWSENPAAFTKIMVQVELTGYYPTNLGAADSRS